MPAPPPHLRADLFHPGQRIAVAVSGGADSVALLRRMLEDRTRLGIVLSVAHVHHGIRGSAADADAGFVAALAAAHDLPFHLHRGDAPAAAQACRQTLEEAARNLRYTFFAGLMEEGVAESVATAHTMDDQAETVLYKLLRGAWTEGLSGIHPTLTMERGSILRPFLEATRTGIEAWLRQLNQRWREDESNCDPAHTRNRIRHELMPMLRGFNPGVAQQLARLASIAADEEGYWEGEMRRLLPSLLLPGKPARGGGRSSYGRDPGQATVGIELARLAQMHPAVRRRVWRTVARRMGSRLSFDQTEGLLALGGPSRRSGEILAALPGGLVARRTRREVRLTKSPPLDPAPPDYAFPIPGAVHAPAYGIRLRVELAVGHPAAPPSAILRRWKAGDRVTLRHTRGPKRVKEVLDRLRIEGERRERWPVVEVGGRIVWMRGAEVDAPQFIFTLQSETAAADRQTEAPDAT